MKICVSVDTAHPHNLRRLLPEDRSSPTHLDFLNPKRIALEGILGYHILTCKWGNLSQVKAHFVSVGVSQWLLSNLDFSGSNYVLDSAPQSLHPPNTCQAWQGAVTPHLKAGGDWIIGYVVLGLVYSFNASHHNSWPKSQFSDPRESKSDCGILLGSVLDTAVKFPRHQVSTHLAEQSFPQRRCQVIWAAHSSLILLKKLLWSLTWELMHSAPPSHSHHTQIHNTWNSCEQQSLVEEK